MDKGELIKKIVQKTKNKFFVRRFDLRNTLEVNFF